MDLTEQIDQNIQELKTTIESIESKCKEAPKGALRISRLKNGKIRYYHTYVEDATGDRHDKYISKKKDSSLIEQLAQKRYLNALKPVLEKELGILQYMKEHYRPTSKEKVFEAMAIERKAVVKPYFLSAEESYIRWKSEIGQVCEAYPEYLRYETNRGEFVRSKSELIIANLLYEKKENLHYRYEEALELKRSNIVVHPDFTIMSRKTGKITYWEHAGMLDRAHYADEFVRKMNAYMKEGICPGKNLIITYETGEVPLDVGVVRGLINQYF